MSDQPKPTGEWTAYQVFEIMGTDNGDDGWKRERLVADAHNAALAAEHKLYLATLVVAETQAKELAAEREKVQTLVEQLNVLLDCVDYKAHNCSANQQVGAVLPVVVIDNSRDALAKVKEGK